MIQNLATPALNNVADAITSGVDPDEFVAAMHCNPQGEVWRNAEGVLLHDCGNCGRPRTTNGDCECQGSSPDVLTQKPQGGPNMMTEFSAIAMNDSAVEKCRVIRKSFSDALSAIKQHVKPGRELALATTKMQEACMWAIRGVAMDPANQHPTQPGSETTEADLDRAPIGGQRHG